MTVPLPLVILALATTAAALPPADCTALIMATSRDVTYRSRAVFPEPAQSVSVRFFAAGTPVGRTAVCGFTFTPDTAQTTLTITTARFGSFSRIFPDGFKDTGILALDLVYANETLGTPVRSVVLYDPIDHGIS